MDTRKTGDGEQRLACGDTSQVSSVSVVEAFAPSGEVLGDVAVEAASSAGRGLGAVVIAQQTAGVYSGAAGSDPRSDLAYFSASCSKTTTAVSVERRAA